MHHAVGIGLIIMLIAFAFGERFAKIVVGAGLILAALVIVSIGFMVVMGLI